MRRWTLLLLSVLAGCGDAGTPPRPPATSGAAAASAEQLAEADRLGMPVAIESVLGQRFVLVPTGEFRMGEGRPDDLGPEGEAPHDVRLVSACYLQAREVTVAEWRAVMGGDPPTGAEADRPVTGVSHEEALRYAARLTERDPRWIFRLPREAEWEHGAVQPGTEGTGAEPWEWCADWFGPYPAWGVTNPEGPDHGTARVIRGGPRGGHARRRAAPGEHPADVGVRLVAELSYGKADLGACEVTYVTAAPDEPDLGKAERHGFEVRIVSVPDRLGARQAGRELPWVTLRGRSSPLRVHLPPGRYYAIAVTHEEGVEVRGLEAKYTVEGPSLLVRVPTPAPGARLRKPQ